MRTTMRSARGLHCVAVPRPGTAARNFVPGSSTYADSIAPAPSEAHAVETSAVDPGTESGEHLGATARSSSPHPLPVDAAPVSAPIEVKPLTPAVTRVRPVRVVGDAPRTSERETARETAGEAAETAAAPRVPPSRNERETVPVATDLSELRRYSTMTPFAMEAPHSGWRWFVGVAAAAFVASGVLVLFDGL